MPMKNSRGCSPSSYNMQPTAPSDKANTSDSLQESTGLLGTNSPRNDSQNFYRAKSLDRKSIQNEVVSLSQIMNA